MSKQTDTAPRVSPTSDTEGYVLGPGEGVNLNQAGINISMKALSSDTQGQFSVMEYVAPPRFSGPPHHLHKATLEAFYLLEGNLTFRVDEQTIEATPGSFVYIPTGCAHSFANNSDAPARFLIFMTPGGFENYFFEVGDLVREEGYPPKSMDKLQAIVARYDQYPPGAA